MVFGCPGIKEDKPVQVIEPTRARLLMRPLEPRILLDAAGGETALSTASEIAHGSLADAYVEAGEVGPTPENTAWKRAQQTLEFTPPYIPEFADTPDEQRSEIAFIATDVPDAEALIQSLAAHVEVVVLDGGIDGISQIADVLAYRKNIDAVHIFSHGSSGSLALGGLDLTSETMLSAYATGLEIIGQSLVPQGDILIYGCDFGSGITGREAVATLARLTGADVAASDDITGHAKLGGNWELERSVGAIETITLDAGVAWFGTLAPEILVSHETDPNDIDHDEEISSNRAVGQTFRHNSGTATYQIDQIDLVLQQHDSGSAENVTIEIRATVNGPSIASGTISSAGFDDDYEWHSFMLDSATTLNSNQTYFLIFFTDGLSGTVDVGVEHDGQYFDGNYIRPDTTPKFSDDVLFRLIDNHANSDPVITSGEGQFYIIVDADENQTTVTNVTATDADAGDTLSYSIIGGEDASLFSIDPVSGELVFNTAPDFGPPGDADGNNVYEVDVQVSDGNGGTDVQQIDVRLQDVNDVPEATDDSFTVAEDGSVSIDVLANDTDDDGDALTITLVEGQPVTDGGSSVPVPNGLVQLVAGELVFTPALNYNGPVSFNYTVSDGIGGTVTAIAFGTVNPANDAPVAGDNSYATNEDIPVNGNAITDDTGLGVDNDIDGDALSVEAGFVGTFTTLQGGSITLAADGDFTFTPAINFNGTDTFIYAITDGALTDTATLTFAVTAVNDAPVADADLFTVPEDGWVSIDVLVNDIDPDGDGLTITQVDGQSIVDGGPLIPVANGSVQLVSGELIFMPTANYTGPASFTYQISDGNGGFDVGSVSGSVGGTNDAPNAVDDTFTVVEEGTATIVALSNDIDIDGDTPFVTEVDGQAIVDAGAAVSVVNGTVRLIAGELLFSPVADYVGAISFTYTIADGNGGFDTASVMGDVTPINDAPLANADSFTVSEDGMASINVLGNDTDPDGDALTITHVNSQIITDGGLGVTVVNGTVQLVAGELIFRPEPNYNGPVSFTYTASDGNGEASNAAVSGTVTPANDAPVATENVYSANEDGFVNGNAITGNTGLGIDSDIDGDTLTLDAGSVGTFATAQGGSITLSSDGSFTYTPSLNFNGTDSFAYTVSDGALTDTATLTFDIGPVNDAPVATDNTYTLQEDSLQTGNAITDDTGFDADSDLDGDALSLDPGFVGSFATLQGGSITLSPGGDFVYSPPPNFSGTDTFIYAVTDGALGASATLVFDITPANDNPVAQSNSYNGIEDGGVVTGNVLIDDTGAGVDADSDGDTLQVLSFTIAGFVDDFDADESVILSGVGTLRISTSGAFTFSPVANYNGAVPQVTYTIGDGQGGASASILDITIAAVNDAPVSTGNSMTAIENEPMAIPASAFRYIDVEGDNLQSITIDNLSLEGGRLTHSMGTIMVTDGMTLSVGQLADLTFEPSPDSRATVSFSYTVNDADNGAQAGTMTIIVSEPSSPTNPVTDSDIDPIPETDPETETESEEEPEPETANEPSLPVLEGTTSSTPVSATPPQLVLPQPQEPIPPFFAQPEPIADLPPQPTVEPPKTAEPPSISAPITNYGFEPINRDIFNDNLKETGDKIRQYDSLLGTTTAKVTFAFGAALGVGSVSWLLQSGILAATLLSSLPAWKRFDPIAIVSGRHDEGEEDGLSDIEMMRENIRNAGARAGGRQHQ